MSFFKFLSSLVGLSSDGGVIKPNHPYIDKAVRFTSHDGRGNYREAFVYHVSGIGGKNGKWTPNRNEYPIYSEAGEGRELVVYSSGVYDLDAKGLADWWNNTLFDDEVADDFTGYSAEGNYYENGRLQTFG